MGSERRPDGHSEEVVERLRHSLRDGADWFDSLLDAMAAWTLPEETGGDRHYRYFIAGEAFDWLLLAERLCGEVQDLIPRQPLEALLLGGTLPATTAPDLLRERLGGDKHRGYLNYFYGVTVEEALQLANERDVQKRHMSNGKPLPGGLLRRGFCAHLPHAARDSADTVQGRDGIPGRRRHDAHRAQGVHLLALQVEAASVGRSEGRQRHPEGPPRIPADGIGSLTKRTHCCRNPIRPTLAPQLRLYLQHPRPTLRRPRQPLPLPLHHVLRSLRYERIVRQPCRLLRQTALKLFELVPKPSPLTVDVH